MAPQRQISRTLEERRPPGGAAAATPSFIIQGLIFRLDANRPAATQVAWILTDTQRHGEPGVAFVNGDDPLAEPSDVLEVLMRLRQQDRQRGQRMSPETGQQQRFVREW